MVPSHMVRPQPSTPKQQQQQQQQHRASPLCSPPTGRARTPLQRYLLQRERARAAAAKRPAKGTRLKLATQHCLEFCK